VIVLDASAAIELLLNAPLAPRISRHVFCTGESLHAPHLIDVEVTQVLVPALFRRWFRKQFRRQERRCSRFVRHAGCERNSGAVADVTSAPFSRWACASHVSDGEEARLFAAKRAPTSPMTSVLSLSLYL